MESSPTVMEAVRLSEDYLEKRGIESPRLSAEHLLARALDCSRLDLYLRFEERLTGRVLEQYRTDLKKRAEHYPLQYILGEVEFVSLPFKVTEEVFIPRPETELLVEWIEESLGSGGDVRFVEFGVGSGAISGALAGRHAGWKGMAVDISPRAAKLAAENLAALAVSDRVSVFVGSSLDTLAGGQGFDLLVSNPPYIPTGEIEALQKEVVRYESRNALDGGADGLDFYPHLARAGARILGPGGMIALETGDGQADRIMAMLEEEGYTDIVMRKDYNGLERMVAAFRPARGEGEG